MPCVNKSLPAYKELSKIFGDSLAESIVVRNNFVVPTIADAIQTVRGTKVLQFKKALRYLKTLTSSSVEDLVNNFGHILSKVGDKVYIVKGSRLSEKPAAMAKQEIEDANYRFLQSLNMQYPGLFAVSAFNNELNEDQQKEMMSFTNELIESKLISNVYIDMVKRDPVSFWKFVAQQAQNMTETGEVNKEFDSSKAALDQFGEVVVNYAKELFPAKPKEVESPVANMAKEALSERLSGDELEDVYDTMDELTDAGAEITSDGSVIVYHRTSAENKEKIEQNGEMFGLEDGLFFSTKRDGSQAEGYGDAVVKLKIPLEKLQLDDKFPDEAHLRLPTKKANEKVNVKDYQIMEAAQDKTVTPAPGTYVVAINKDVLAQIADQNKQSQTAPELASESVEETDTDALAYQKLDSDYWKANQKKRFALKSVMTMLNRKFGVQFETVDDNNTFWRGKFTKEGKIVINEAFVTPDTPFHEVAHPFTMLLRKQNTALYNKMAEEVQTTDEGKAALEEVQRKYPELSAADQVDEALVQLIGKYAGAKSLEAKPWYAPFIDWLKGILASIGINTKSFKVDMSIKDFADLIIDPSFVFDLDTQMRQIELEERYSKVDDELAFDRLLDDTMRKLKADVSIPAQNDTERTRKYWSQKQIEGIQANRRDLKALDSYILSGLSQLKGVTTKFEEFKNLYSAKDKKSPQDVKKLAQVLKEIEDTVVIYSNMSPLIDSIEKVFEDDDEAGHFSNLRNYIKKQNDLVKNYTTYGLDLVADWLMPYMKKSINQAIATNNHKGIVTPEVYSAVETSLRNQGITDKRVILEKAAREEIKNTLLTAKKDASNVTMYLSGVLDSRDVVSSLVGQALIDQVGKGMKKAHAVKENIEKALRRFRGNVAFTNDAKEKEFYQQFMREADSWEYQGLDEKGQEKYEYKKRWAFHEEYFWDKFYNAKREFFDKLGPAPSRENEAAYNKWKAQYDQWFAQNTKGIEDKNGKKQYIPADAYKNSQFQVLQQNELFKTMYDAYKDANLKIGHQGLRYGIIPQIASNDKTPSKKSFKPKNLAESLRSGLGDQEQIYFAQNIEGYERKTVPIAHTHLLDEDQLSFNLANSVAQFSVTAHKYEAVKGVEPHVTVLKNFIGGNAYLKIDKRTAFKTTGSGIKALIKSESQAFPVEATHLNKQLNSFLNDVVYGESLRKEVVQMWDAKYVVYDNKQKNPDGSSKRELIHGFENLRQFINQPNLDYSGFEYNKDRTIGDYTIKMVVKDWNFSLKKTANNLGLLTALQNMAVNVNAIIANVGIGKMQYLSEAAGGKHFTLKNLASAEKTYWSAVGSGSFFEDIKGDKPSLLGQLNNHYETIQGEMIDSVGKKIEPAIANKLFRRSHLFFGQNAGEHYIQTTLMVAMMKGQKVKTSSGQEISLFDAYEKGKDGYIKLQDGVQWTPEQDQEFKDRLTFVNKQLNGNYSKMDKAYIQRSWWGSMLMMFRKHIYNGFAARYRKGYVNYTTGNYTEGYYRTFFNGLFREVGDMVLDMKLKKVVLTDQEKYARNKLAADLAIFVGLLFAFKAFDDDDDENEFTDEVAFMTRRLISDNAQYSPIVGTLELAKVVRDPAASVNLIENYWDFGKQLLTDPSGEYDKSGPGYDQGDLKWKTKLGRLMPVYRSFINAQEPERLLQFYRGNSIFFLQPDDGKQDDETSN